MFHLHWNKDIEALNVNACTPCGVRMKGVCPRKRKVFKPIEVGKAYVPVGLLNVEINSAIQLSKSF